MAAIDNYQLSLDPTFRNRVCSILSKVATQIQGEEPAPGGTYPPAAVLKRGDLAENILNDLFVI